MGRTTAISTLRAYGSDLRVETWVEPKGKKRNRREVRRRRRVTAQPSDRSARLG